MNDLNLERTPLKIKDSQVFDILVNGERVSLLAPFLTQPRTVSAAAKMSGQGVKKMGYWVERFVEYGLLRQVSPASGRQGAMYQVTAQHFVIEDLDAMLVNDSIREQFEPLWQTFINNVCLDSQKYADRWDFHVFSDESGNMVRDFTPSWDRGNHTYQFGAVIGQAFNNWAFIPLERSDAQEFMRRLETLLTEYVQKAKHSPETGLYLVHLGLVRSESGIE